MFGSISILCAYCIAVQSPFLFISQLGNGLSNVLSSGVLTREFKLGKLLVQRLNCYSYSTKGKLYIKVALMDGDSNDTACTDIRGHTRSNVYTIIICLVR